MLERREGEEGERGQITVRSVRKREEDEGKRAGIEGKEVRERGGRGQEERDGRIRKQETGLSCLLCEGGIEEVASLCVHNALGLSCAA